MRLQTLTAVGCHADRVVIGSSFVSLNSSSTVPAVVRTTRTASALPAVARQVSFDHLKLTVSVVAQNSPKWHGIVSSYAPSCWRLPDFRIEFSGHMRSFVGVGGQVKVEG